jgi:transposase InsO family protein
VREGGGDQGFERANELSWTIFENTRDLLGDLLGAKNAGVTSDNGSELRDTQVEEFLDEEGIKHELSAPYTPQQNGIVERKNRTLIEAARTMLDEYKTPNSFWAEAINTACHAAN